MIRAELTGLAGVVERNIYLVKRYGWWEVAFFAASGHAFENGDHK